MADTSKESTETSPPALPLAATSLMEVGFGEARCQQSSLPDWALPMLQIQSSALSVICVWNSGKMTDGKKFSSITRWRARWDDEHQCLQKQGHDRHQACPECGKKNQRYVSTWDVAQPWGINEPTPTPMKWRGRQWKAFPYPIQWGGPALDWEEEWRGGGKKGCAKPTETCRHDRHKHWQQLTQTPNKTTPHQKKHRWKKTAYDEIRRPGPYGRFKEEENPHPAHRFLPDNFFSRRFNAKQDCNTDLQRYTLSDVGGFSRNFSLQLALPQTFGEASLRELLSKTRFRRGMNLMLPLLAGFLHGVENVAGRRHCIYS